MLKHYLAATLLLATAGSALFGAAPPRDWRGASPPTAIGHSLAILRWLRSCGTEGEPRHGRDSYRQQILGGQTALRAESRNQNVHVTGAVQTVLNAVFVVASKDQAAQLRGLNGSRR